MDSEMMKLDTLLRYTVKHNKEHAEELKNLAQKAKELRKTAVYDDIVEGVQHMNRANETLESALRGLME